MLPFLVFRRENNLSLSVSNLVVLVYLLYTYTPPHHKLIHGQRRVLAFRSLSFARDRFTRFVLACLPPRFCFSRDLMYPPQSSADILHSLLVGSMRIDGYVPILQQQKDKETRSWLGGRRRGKEGGGTCCSASPVGSLRLEGSICITEAIINYEFKTMLGPLMRPSHYMSVEKEMSETIKIMWG